ncbi:MAG: S-layer homology domain-containing protein [Clostridiales bacterium]|jgi:hypothetical protein|nr:S-layer homology domain-containing protein [Clostridiales bacterium]
MIKGKAAVFLSAVIFSLALLLDTQSVSAAVKYKDVGETHWAYTAIARVSEDGLIVGDAQGNFKPDAPIDKFETAKILAKAAGYKYIGASSEELSYYARSYEKNKSLLSQYAKDYSKWKSVANSEIAYLLERQIFTAQDIKQFIVKDENGVQHFRALSRQEVSVFFVRLMGLTEDDLEKSDYTFADDATIKDEYKPYVYFLHSMNIISGGTNVNFLPNDAVTRASMAVLLTKTLDLLAEAEKTGTKFTSDDPNAVVIESVSGILDKIHPGINSIQLVTSTALATWEMSENISVSIDGYLKTRSDLKSGMVITGVLLNQKLIDIQAYTPEKAAVGTNTMEGVLEEIFISSNKRSISLKDGSGQVNQLAVSTENVDVYSLRIGMKLKVAFNSNIVTYIEII